MREVRYTTRFQRDYRREESGRHGVKLDALLMDVVNLLAAPEYRFTHCPANGTTTAPAASGRISFSPTATG
jgi:hypothetical protein